MSLGPLLSINDLANPTYISSIHTISQTVDTEIYILNDCINYPNENYKTFKDCDYEFVQKEVSKFGFVPFWATNDLSKVTKIRCPIIPCAHFLQLH